MTSDLYNQIVSQRGSLENLISKIPGFKGYMDYEARRAADRLLREHLGKEIDNHIKRYNKLQNNLLDGGKGLKFMSRAREVKSQMQAYHDKVVTSTPRYSGMFEKIKITTEILDKIYAFDEAQFRFLLQFDTALDDLEAAVNSGEGVDAALDTVDNVASTAASAFDMRDSEILNIGS
jgi:hypothetical protein